jgi:HAD superfamily hydrolase (TIGR01484 family)
VSRPSRPRLVACDLDGTLIARDNRLSDRVAAAVERAVRSGLRVVAVTGRPWQWTLDIARAHALLPTAVVSNGAALLHVESGEVESTGLVDGTVHGLIERIRAEVPDVAFAVDGVDVMAYEPGFTDPTYVGDLEVEDLSPLVGQGVIKLICRRQGMLGTDLAALLDHEVLDGVAVPYAGMGEWVELLPDGVSKASGLAMVCERLGIRAAEVVAVGDNWNDLPMLAWAGVGVAMANSSAEMLEIADRVVASADDDGVADLLDELVTR